MNGNGDHDGHNHDRWKRYRKRGNGKAHFGNVDTARLIEVINGITEEGGAVRLGRSRDGGVFNIGVYGCGEDSFTVYLHTGDEILEFLIDVLQEMNHPHDG